MINEQFVSRHIQKVSDTKNLTEDNLAIEEPLELRLAGETIATTMRTPGHDFLLAKGFFFCEGFITAPSQIGTVFHCGRPNTPEFGNVVDVLPAPGVLFNFEGGNKVKRGTIITSACGVCGRTQIDDLISNCPPFDTFAPVQNDLVKYCIQTLSQNQPLFDLTGGVHAAAAFDQNNHLLASYEDVGRHNATDKVIGKLLENDMIGKASVLVVSGRIGFEIVQKAAKGRIPIIMGISAPTSLAVELAQSFKQTLIGFVRGNRWSIYTGEF